MRFTGHGAVGLWFALAFTTLLASPMQVPELVLAERGGKSACEIVIPASASRCLKFAAEELSNFIARQTAVTLPVVERQAKLPGLAIVLSENFPGKPESFRLRALPAQLYVEGAGARGALYGVYELLERFGACAWYGPEFSVVPELQRFAVPGDLHEIQEPAFALRSMIINGWSADNVHAARNKLNLEGFDEKLGSSTFRFDPVLGKCHTFEKLLPSAKWFAHHPEYFSERNGRRVKEHTQLCLTNVEVLRLCVEKTLKRLEESYPKGIRRYGISPNDWGSWCECANCAALDRREGSHSGTLLNFVNQIAAAVEEKYPEAIIQTLAYSYARRPPKTLVPRKNVQICFCTFECDFFLPIARGRSIENRAVRHALKRIKAYPSRLSVWDYAGDFACYHHVWPNFHSLQENIRLFHESGAEEIFELGTGGGRDDIWANLRAWCIAKWMWNPQLEGEALLRRAFADCFGPAAKAIHRYHKLVHATSRDTKLHPMRCFESVYSPGVSDALLSEAALIMAEARRLAEGTKFATNVLNASLPVDFMRAMRGYARPSMSAAPIDAAQFLSEQAGARRVMAHVSPPSSLRFADDRVWEARFKRRLSDFAQMATLPKPSRRLGFEEWALTGMMPVNFSSVADPLAGDARAVRLNGDLAHSSCWFELDSVLTDSDAIYMPRVRLRVGPSKPRTMVFFAGIYNLNLRKTTLANDCRREDLPPGAPQAGEAYFWYNVGAIKPKRGDVIWLALGKSFGDRHPDVWIDRIELCRLSPF